MNWNGRQVLVTGAGGFIASHLVERLAALGARPRAFVHYRSNGSWGWLDSVRRHPNVEVVAGDIRDRDAVTKAVQGVDTVFHLAALIAIPYSYQAPLSFVRTNIEGTLNVLQAARDGGVKKVIHTSTSETYGTARSVPIREDHPLQAQSPYAASKIGADKLAESFALSFDMPVVTVRPFNTYGPRQSARAIIPTIITQILADEAVYLGNLTPTRDFNFVTDVVEGFVKAAEASEAVGKTFNLGSGKEISVGDLVPCIARLIGKEIKVLQSEDRVRPNMSEVERLVADASMARRILGWQPTYSLEQGLKVTIDWFKEHLDRYRPGVYVV